MIRFLQLHQFIRQEVIGMRKWQLWTPHHLALRRALDVENTATRADEYMVVPGRPRQVAELAEVGFWIRGFREPARNHVARDAHSTVGMVKAVDGLHEPSRVDADRATAKRRVEIVDLERREVADRLAQEADCVL